MRTKRLPRDLTALVALAAEVADHMRNPNDASQPGREPPRWTALIETADFEMEDLTVSIIGAADT